MIALMPDCSVLSRRSVSLASASSRPCFAPRLQLSLCLGLRNLFFRRSHAAPEPPAARCHACPCRTAYQKPRQMAFRKQVVQRRRAMLSLGTVVRIPLQPRADDCSLPTSRFCSGVAGWVGRLGWPDGAKTKGAKCDARMSSCGALKITSGLKTNGLADTEKLDQARRKGHLGVLCIGLGAKPA